MALLVIQAWHPFVVVADHDAATQSLVIAHTHRRTQSEMQCAAEGELEQNPPAEISEKVFHSPQTFTDEYAH